MGGFSLDLGYKGKKAGKKKRSNVFGEDEQGKKKTKIKLTHVDEHQENKDDDKLVIEPEMLRSSFFDNRIPAEMDGGDTRPKYGLIRAGEDDQKNDASKGQEHINVKLPNEDLLPEVTREEEYEKVPVEEFGEALLRGMGWDGREDERNNGDPPAPKPQFLGLGAKAMPKRNYKGGNRDQEDTYMPVVKIDKKTGEKIT